MQLKRSLNKLLDSMGTNHKNIYYFIGIGGVGMSALASLCLEEGHQVYGYDRTPSEITNQLIQNGIEIRFDSSLSALQDFLLSNTVEVVYSAAIPESHPQLIFYKKQGNKVIKRAKFLANLCDGKKTLAIAGTHGKTTTSSILTHIFDKTNQSFTSIMGGFFNNTFSNFFKNGSEVFIVEADEYDRSFLHLRPTLACITSLDPDHLDIYKTKTAFVDAFIQFSEQVNQDLIVAHGLPISGYTYGIEVEADYKAFNIKKSERGYHFDLTTPNEKFKNIYLNLIGTHNLSNSLAAIAMADQFGLNTENVVSVLKNFPGVYRRMNVYKWDDKIIIDDYAHHPVEIEGVFKTIKSFYPKQKSCVVFQPHLFSRTRDLMKDFITVLSKFDEVILMDIYPAREKPIKGINVKSLLDGISHKRKRYIQKNEIQMIFKTSKANIFALLGAGDIGFEIQQLKSKFVTI